MCLVKSEKIWSGFSSLGGSFLRINENRGTERFVDMDGVLAMIICAWDLWGFEVWVFYLTIPISLSGYYCREWTDTYSPFLPQLAFLFLFLFCFHFS